MTNENVVEKKTKFIRVKDICFAKSEANPDRIKEVLSEIITMQVMAPALMTPLALCQYMNAPQYVAYKMSKMEIGTSFEYDGLIVTRWGDNLYNAM